MWLRAGDAVLMLERRPRGSDPEARSGHVLAFAAAGVAIADRTSHTLFFQDPDGRRVGRSSFPQP